MRRLAAVLALVLVLAGCSAVNDDELQRLAQADFDALVDQAAAVDTAVLRTLDVEEPATEPCGAQADGDDPDAEHTVLVAAGTMAIGTTGVEERDLLAMLEPPAGSDEEPRWTVVERPDQQRAWVATEGITASATIDDGLLVIAVFTPCR